MVRVRPTARCSVNGSHTRFPLIASNRGWSDHTQGEAITLKFFFTHPGIPVSTTHTIMGAIVGVGASRRVSAVRWGVAKSIVTAWIVTLPAAGQVAAVFDSLGFWMT